jgi:hypothetical protein
MRGNRRCASQSAHLAVRDHGKSGVFLQADRRIDRRILDPLEFGRTELASIPALPRQKQFGRPEKAADHVGTRHQHGASLEAGQPPRRTLVAGVR